MRQVIRSGNGSHADDATPHTQRATLDRFMPFAVALVPLAMALLLVPGRTLSPAACPPSGEGLLGCQITKGWAPYVTSVCLVWLGLYMAGQFVFLVLPRIIAHLRAGDRLRQEAPLPRVASHADPALAAAVWGQSTPATPATKVMGGFAWSQAASRVERVTATPQLLAGLARHEPLPAVAPVAAPVADERPPFQPVALQGGLSLHVCGECLTVVEGEAGAAAAVCPACGVETHHRSGVHPIATPRRTAPSPAATRVILLSAGLDGRSLGRLEEAITRRAGEPRRVVVLQLPADEQATPAALRALERAVHAARGAEGEIIAVAADPELRAELETTGLAVARSTSRAMELAADLAPTRAGGTAAAGHADRMAL